MLRKLWRKLFGNWLEDVVVVTVPLRITEDQRQDIKKRIQADLPPDAIVLVLDAGMCAGTIR